jgi:RNA polymerase sigma factor (sigma-70 family)
MPAVVPKLQADMISFRMPSRPSQPEQETPVSLILRLRDGTQEEWRTFWEIYGPVTYRFARGAGLRHHDADDVVSEVMRSLHTRIRGGLMIDHAKGRFRGYLARTTQRAVERHRSHFSSSTAEEKSPTIRSTHPAPVSQTIEGFERLERLRLCMDRLRGSRNVRQRDVDAFEKYVLLEEPAEKVATRYGISRGRLYGIASEMMDRIRKLILQLDLELGEV